MFTNEGAKYADNWKLSCPDGKTQPLALMPAFMRATTSDGYISHGNIYTVFRYRMGNYPMLATAGLMTAAIPTFCGGTTVWAINASTRRPDFSWSANLEDWYNSLPSIEDFLGENWLEWGKASYAACPLPHAAIWVGVGQTPADWRVPAEIAAASVFARFLADTAIYNRNIISFWDRQSGNTRRMMQWFHRLFSESKGIRCNKPYVDRRIQYAERWGNRNTSSAYPKCFSPPLEAEYEEYQEYANCYTTAVVPSHFDDGEFRENYNSGSQVSAGCMHTDRTWDGRMTRIKYFPHRDFASQFCGQPI